MDTASTAKNQPNATKPLASAMSDRLSDLPNIAGTCPVALRILLLRSRELLGHIPLHAVLSKRFGRKEDRIIRGWRQGPRVVDARASAPSRHDARTRRPSRTEEPSWTRRPTSIATLPYSHSATSRSVHRATPYGD